jgi:hypothetical protein
MLSTFSVGIILLKMLFVKFTYVLSVTFSLPLLFNIIIFIIILYYCAKICWSIYLLIDIGTFIALDNYKYDLLQILVLNTTLS